VSASAVEADTISAIDGGAAESTARAQAADLRILSGLVRADAVRVTARAVASGRDAQVSAEGSSVERVLIDDDNDPLTPPVQVEGSAANVVVELEPAIFGAGSYVAILERIATVDDDGDPATSPVFTSAPPAGQLEGDAFAAGLSVNGIHVHISGGTVPAADVIVAQASADAAYPQSFACTVPQLVNGSAFVLSAQSSQEVAPMLQGFVRIASATGGEADRQTLGLEIPGVLVADLGTSHAEGVVDALGNTSTASSFAELSDLCLLPIADPSSGTVTCAFEAQLVRANASAEADGEDAGFAGAVTILDRDGHVIPTSPDDGPEIEVAGVARIFFHVQESAPQPFGASSSETTVTAVVIELLDPEHAGSVIRVGEAHAGAFAPASTPTDLPEPGSAATLGVGMLAVIALRTRARRRAGAVA
jgi:hypothetical protein